MRHLLCQNCSKDEKAGERQTHAASIEGPAEFERNVFGTALPPRPEQRIIKVNDTPFPLAPDHYDCDSCMKPIKPGERCCAASAWVAGRPVGEWEHEFLLPEEGN